MTFLSGQSTRDAQAMARQVSEKLDLQVSTGTKLATSARSETLSGSSYTAPSPLIASSVTLAGIPHATSPQMGLQAGTPNAALITGDIPTLPFATELQAERLDQPGLNRPNWDFAPLPQQDLLATQIAFLEPGLIETDTTNLADAFSEGSDQGLSIDTLIQSNDPTLISAETTAALIDSAPDAQMMATPPVVEPSVKVDLALNAKSLPSGRSISWVTPDTDINKDRNAAYVGGKQYCSLTFDDGPDPIKDNKIMDILARENIKATFFVMGNRLGPGQSTIERMMREGHEVGNHSWSHPQLTKLGNSSMRSQLERTDERLKGMGVNPVVFRPPYGAHNASVRQAVASLGMKTLMWDVDSLDWKLKNAAAIRRKIDQQSAAGSVILMHSHVSGTVAALPDIISDLKAKGCVFVTASQWLQGMNYSGGQRYDPATASKSSSSSRKTAAPKPAKSTPSVVEVEPNYYNGNSQTTYSTSTSQGEIVIY